MIDLSSTRNRVWLGALATLIVAFVAWRIIVYLREEAARRCSSRHPD
jgi:hypothetical protein